MSFGGSQSFKWAARKRTLTHRATQLRKEQWAVSVEDKEILSAAVILVPLVG